MVTAIDQAGPLKIYPNITKNWVFLILCVCGLILFSSFLYDPYKSIQSSSSWLTVLSFYLLVAGSVIGILRSLSWLLFPKPSITISNLGINHTVGPFAMGFVEWSEIEQAYIRDISFWARWGKQVLILTKPIKSGQVLARLGPYQRFWFSLFQHLGRPSIVITELQASITMEESASVNVVVAST